MIDKQTLIERSLNAGDLTEREALALAEFSDEEVARLVEGRAQTRPAKQQRADDVNAKLARIGTFKALSGAERDEFRQYARDTYVVGTLIPSTWHPTVRNECALMNQEAGL